MKKYVSASLEAHLFFGRIMKEHALFLLAAFPAGETKGRCKANCFREKFENVLRQTVCLANGWTEKEVLCSGEVFTEFTEMAECQTIRLTKIPIDVQITQAEKKLHADCGRCPDRCLVQQVKRLNQNVLLLLEGLLAFKEKILQEVLACRLYTANYPLLLEHIIREARLYRQTITELEEKGCVQSKDLQSEESFWNQIMMEHAMFIRGMLDPTECELMETADAFAGDYCRLLKEAEKQDCRAMRELTGKTLEITEKYRDFKASGTEGITGCRIRSVILPLLADHVLREANHYLRILQNEERQ